MKNINIKNVRMYQKVCYLKSVTQIFEKENGFIKIKVIIASWSQHEFMGNGRETIVLCTREK